MNRRVGYTMPVTERDASPLDEGRGSGVSDVSKRVLDGALHWQDVTHVRLIGVLRPDADRQPAWRYLQADRLRRA